MKDFWDSAEDDDRYHQPASPGGQIYVPRPRAQRNLWSPETAMAEIGYYRKHPAYVAMPSTCPEDYYPSQESNAASFQMYPDHPPSFKEYPITSRHIYCQRFFQNSHMQDQNDFKTHDTQMNERVQQNIIKAQPQNKAPVPIWTPECYPDPETGEMHSIPGTAQVYSNGQKYPNAQIYIDTKVARNMPTDRPIRHPNEVPTPQPDSYSEQLEMNPRPKDYEQWNYAPMQLYTTQYSRNECNWPVVYEIYGTVIGIILKCMYTEISPRGYPPPDLFRQDKWLQEQGLPYPYTRWILDRYYYTDEFFYQVGERVQIGVHKRKELKEKIKVGLNAGLWPGDTDFSEMRGSCEILRRRALEFLERCGDIFEKEWRTLRGRQVWGFYHQCT